MASDASGDKTAAGEGARFFGGPRAIGALLPGVTKAAFRARSPATAQILMHWPEIVGPALAAATLPRRLAAGTLTIVCTGPIALELQHLTGQLAERINGHFGRVLVERFRFLQGDVPLAPPPQPKPKSPPPLDIPGMPAGELRDALAHLGAVIVQARSRERA